MQYKTPGVYIVEKDAFPNTVVEVPTAIPAFLGYTEKAQDGSVAKKYVPTYIESMADYVKVFGGPQAPVFTLAESTDKTHYTAALDAKHRFFLYYAVNLYFANGGGPAYVVSVGTYADAIANDKSPKDFTPDPDPKNPNMVAPFDALRKVLDVTLIVAPDTVLLASVDDCYGVWAAALGHCNTMQSRMALIDIFGGDQPRTHNADTDVISGAKAGFREKIGTDFLNYGTAYYPWVNFNVVNESGITYNNLDAASLTTLAAALNQELALATPQPPAPLKEKMTALFKQLAQVDMATASDSDKASVARNHNQLLSVSALYKRAVNDMLQQANQMPPCGAMAGVYARVDANEGVFKAPANTSINLAVSPVVDITAEDQEDLNMPLDGRAVNAIRNIPGRGLVVWGARTLDGNSGDWRYINVRRTLIMLEQSIKAAATTYVFAPNDASTWVAVKSMIYNFLLNQWKDGALQGAKPDDAFSVSVGLGATMTGEDILQGIMRVTILVAIVHPAEFIELTFQQQMAVS